VTRREIRVVYTKFDGSLHWHQVMHYLGEDEHGIWLGARRRGRGRPAAASRPSSSSSRSSS
jgi:hypothetical protein